MGYAFDPYYPPCLDKAQALAKMFGVKTSLPELAAARNEEAAEQYASVREAMDETLAVLNRSEAGPRAGWSTASIFSEGTHPDVLENAFDFLVYDRELGRLPVYVVVPGNPDVNDLDDRKHVEQFKQMTGLHDDALARLAEFGKTMRHRYLALSSNATLRIAPAAATRSAVPARDGPSRRGRPGSRS